MGAMGSRVVCPAVELAAPSVRLADILTIRAGLGRQLKCLAPSATWPGGTTVSRRGDCSCVGLDEGTPITTGAFLGNKSNLPNTPPATAANSKSLSSRMGRLLITIVSKLKED